MIDKLPMIDSFPSLPRALCVEVDPYIFFPKRSDHITSRTAREVCMKCPEIEPCRQFAINHPELQHGVWGGLTSRELGVIRGRIKKNANKAA